MLNYNKKPVPSDRIKTSRTHSSTCGQRGALQWSSDASCAAKYATAMLF